MLKSTEGTKMQDTQSYEDTVCSEVILWAVEEELALAIAHATRGSMSPNVATQSSKLIKDALAMGKKVEELQNGVYYTTSPYPKAREVLKMLRDAVALRCAAKELDEKR